MSINEDIHVWGQGVYVKSLYLQFCYEPKTALKIVFMGEKKRKGNKRKGRRE